MRRFRAVRMLAVIAAMALAAAACSGETTTPDASATSGGAPVDTNFTMAYHSEVMVCGTRATRTRTRSSRCRTCTTLTRYDSETQEVVPLLATSWSRTRTARRTFTLRDDVTFHSGRAMTSRT